MYSVMSRVLLRVMYGSLLGVLAGWLLREAECAELRAEIEKLRRDLEKTRGETPAAITPPAETLPADATPDGEKPATEAPPESIMETVKEAVAEVVADIAAIFAGPETVAVTGDSETAKRAIERGLTIPARRGDDTDDLNAITGIGPVINQKLQELGIITFRQLALLTEEQAVLVGESLQLSKERISRENWIGQAKEQHEKKYSEAL
jgi:predicted flap endonuclease-1-like 5' DNA nuclease